MRVMLDANVVLTGALSPNGPASALVELAGDVKFVFSDYVLDECCKQIQNAAESVLVAELSESTVLTFLANASAELVPQSTNRSGQSVADPDDQQIYEDAIANGCDTICTYDANGFLGGLLPTVAPFYLWRQYHPGPLAINRYVQPIDLGKDGSVFLFASLSHPSGLGEVLRSANGTVVSADGSGIIQVTSDSPIRHHGTQSPIPNVRQVALLIRYNAKESFEALTFSPDGGTWDDAETFTSHLLTRADVKIEPPIERRLMFYKEHRFFGTIYNLSGVPKFLRKDKFNAVVRNRTLDAAFGSEDCKYMLQRLAVQFGNRV